MRHEGRGIRGRGKKEKRESIYGYDDYNDEREEGRWKMEEG